MNDIPDVPATPHSHRERGRIQVQGQSTDDNNDHTLLIIHEANGSWAIHGLGAPGARLPVAKMVACASRFWRVLGERAAPLGCPSPAGG